MSRDRRTKEYVAKRTADGKSKKEIIRCLKRYVAREIYRVLQNPRMAPPTNDLQPRGGVIGGVSSRRVKGDEGTRTINELQFTKAKNAEGFTIGV